MNPILQGDNLPGASHKRCMKSRSKLTGNKINTLKTGDQLPNLLADFLQCEAAKNKDVEKKCKDVAFVYAKCHASIMGAGKNYVTGLEHCSAEILKLLHCVEENQ